MTTGPESVEFHPYFTKDGTILLNLLKGLKYYIYFIKLMMVNFHQVHGWCAPLGIGTVLIFASVSAGFATLLRAHPPQGSEERHRWCQWTGGIQSEDTVRDHKSSHLRHDWRQSRYDGHACSTQTDNDGVFSSRILTTTNRWSDSMRMSINWIRTMILKDYSIDS